MSEEQKQRQKEQQRVDDVIEVIQQKEASLEGNSGGLKEDIIDLRKSFWEDVTVNLDEPDDVIETYTSIKQQAELLSERERSHGQLHKQMKTLERLEYSPYFGRIDFKETDEDATEQIYLGIASLMDEKNDDFLIYDWRAPISSVYYDFQPGPAHYETPEGTIHGEVKLKRQFIIRDGRIKGMFDTGMTIGDELLQEVLGGRANTQMKSIVATIQREQNEIIRNERSRYLIVQGVAGSGKTSAALQRVAYLLYRYRESISSENILLFSPNPMFNSYVATVLPELGEENMQQTTFQQYAEKRIGKQFDVEDPFEQMEYLYTAEKDEAYQTRLDGIRFKAGLNFKRMIDRYVSSLSGEGLLFKNIKLRGQMLLTAGQIHDYFYSLDRKLSIANRLSLTKDWIEEQLSKRERIEWKREWVEEELQTLDKETFMKTYQSLQDNRRFSEETFDDFSREQKMLAQKLVRRYFKPIKKKVKRLEFLNVKGVYRQLFKQNGLEVDPPGNWSAISEQTIDRVNQRELPYEDVTPFMYLEDRLKGRQVNTSIRHLFLDEAQDLSPFQFTFLKALFPNSRMTILGDFNQAIYAHAMESTPFYENEWFEKEKQEVISLTRSYRSTRQIVEFSKRFIPNGDKIEAFNREGNKPEVMVSDDWNALLATMKQTIGHMQQKGHETIAIICKSAKESKDAFAKLKDEFHDMRLMDRETYTFQKGLLVIPAYLAKGIEFDAVIIYDASSKTYGTEAERKLFYTACTRAMHELHLFCHRDKSPFFEDVPGRLYLEKSI